MEFFKEKEGLIVPRFQKICMHKMLLKIIVFIFNLIC